MGIFIIQWRTPLRQLLEAMRNDGYVECLPSGPFKYPERSKPDMLGFFCYVVKDPSLLGLSSNASQVIMRVVIGRNIISIAPTISISEELNY